MSENSKNDQRYKIVFIQSTIQTTTFQPERKDDYHEYSTKVYKTIKNVKKVDKE